MEHLNRTVKSHIDALGSNITDRAIFELECASVLFMMSPPLLTHTQMSLEILGGILNAHRTEILLRFWENFINQGSLGIFQVGVIRHSLSFKEICLDQLIKFLLKNGFPSTLIIFFSSTTLKYFGKLYLYTFDIIEVVLF